MKTHELASFLRDLADVLSYLPDTEVAEFPAVLEKQLSPQETTVPMPIPGAERPKKRTSPVNNTDDVVKTLYTLSKRDVVSIINELDLGISVRNKDSSKDVTLKIKSYLNRNPSAARKIRSILKKKHSSSISEPLSKALDTLLGNRDEISVTDR